MNKKQIDSALEIGKTIASLFHRECKISINDYLISSPDEQATELANAKARPKVKSLVAPGTQRNRYLREQRLFFFSYLGIRRTWSQKCPFLTPDWSDFSSVGIGKVGLGKKGERS